MTRLNIERLNKLEPIRVQKARSALENLGLEVVCCTTHQIAFILNGNIIKFFPYSGWHSGKGIPDGRGYQKLMKKIKRVIK